ncbi:hypothetical protein VAS14_20911 [Vibrio angustum S14]|uniref:Uncharacterized protein n=1 Tax=Photobacterium angustum (strain S14 / CCUG 15956) TaxID=314292 RepID=Q1ZLI7_PHOAS|nr:hypothetical protein VAS14_20911 [Vibrio angustum S14] [Photobacterium angustum S14]
MFLQRDVYVDLYVKRLNIKEYFSFNIVNLLLPCARSLTNAWDICRLTDIKCLFKVINFMIVKSLFPCWCLGFFSIENKCILVYVFIKVIGVILMVSEGADGTEQEYTTGCSGLRMRG